MGTKVIKVPIEIVAKIKGLRYIWFHFLRETMKECQMLCNQGIVNGVCFKKRGTGPSPRDPNKSRSLSGAIYDAVKSGRRYVSSGTLSAAVESYVVPVINRTYRGVIKGQNGIPSFRNPMSVFRPDKVSIQAEGCQYVITLPDPQLQAAGVDQMMIANLVDYHVKDRRRQLKSMQSNGKSTANHIKSVQDVLADWEAVKNLIDSGVDIFQELGNSLTIRTMVSKKDRYLQQILVNLMLHKQGLPSGYKLGGSRIIEKDHGLMAYLSFSSPSANQGAALDPNKVMGIDLGVACPIVYAIKDSKDRGYLGDKDEILGMRNKFRALQRRSQRNDGMFSKTNKWETSERETNWADTYYRTMIARLVGDAVRNGIGTIHAEDLSGLYKKMSEFNRLIMNPFKIRSFLEQSCQQKGIRLVFGNPRNSSLRCHKCGYTSKMNRNPNSPRDFKCVHCGDTCNADYNAAINIANWTEDEIKNGIELDDNNSWDDVKLIENLQAAGL